jgi:hypothetical protein
MKKISFYLLINKLYLMSFRTYLNYLKIDILSSTWFKKACKEKKIKIKFLSKNYFYDDIKDYYFKYEKKNLYFFKLFLIKFEYQQDLENNNHLKLLNINIKNETIFKVVTSLFSIQKFFLKTNYYLDMNIIDRKVFISEYIKKYGSYLDTSILSKIINNTSYMNENKIYKLNNLFPKKTFMYSLYIKELINSNSESIKNDDDLVKLLFMKYNIKISRRAVCNIRNLYLIPRAKKENLIDLTLHIKKVYLQRKKLTKKNILILENNLIGVYELSSEKTNNYPFSKNKIIYIGSSSDIKKRLKTYTFKYAHTKNIKEFIKENKNIYFRIIRTLNHKEFERKLINSFINIHGDLPKLNTQRVLNVPNENNYFNKSGFPV